MEATELILGSSTPEAISAWLGTSVQPTTAVVYEKNFMGFYNWLQSHGPKSLRGMTPRELVKKQKALNKAFVLDEIMLPEKKVILHAVLEYVNYKDNAKWRSQYKMKIQSTVRSFFVYYLGRDGFPALSNGEKNRLKGSPKTRKKLTIEIAKAIIDNSNTLYKAVWSSMLASGMGIGEIVKWSNTGIDALRDAVAKPIRVNGEELIEIWLGARKQNTDNDFYVYIGGSALRYLKAYLTHREEMETRFNSTAMREKREQYYRNAGREAPPLPAEFPDAIFVNNKYTPLTTKATSFYWMSQLKQLKFWKSNGRKNDRTNMNVHQIRSIFRTRWAKVALPRDYSAEAQKALGEYFMGHAVDPLDYNQIDTDEEYRIKAYLAALPWLDIEKINIERQSGETFRLEKTVAKLKEELRIANLRTSEENINRLIRENLKDQKE